ncbi:hypothetical protein [Endozoicomonas sp. ONNA2]|uniref:hypothetical protein n=1 Tax=Endozoicomonas sp. ONNA2 TaxID=2828741 RepID=UPI002147F8C3|nr:hypothetical protein [Endozoicomonas sp. ONNA2]
MNKEDLLKKALHAVTCQQTEARNQYRNAADLDRPDLMTFWESRIAEHEETYRALMDWLFTLHRSEGQK